MTKTTGLAGGFLCAYKTISFEYGRKLELDLVLDQLAIYIALLPFVVLLHVSLLLSGELTQSVHNLTIVVLTIAYGIVGTHNSDVDLAGTGTDMVPVDEVNVSKFAQIQLAVLDGQGLAAAEEEVKAGMEQMSEQYNNTGRQLYHKV